MSENNHTPAPFQVSIEVGGRPLILETGKIARQANCAVTARYGDTIVLVSACMSNKPNDRDFLPLTVDYRENTYSAGKIPGGFFKREGRPTEKEILTSRLIDRPMRPLFPDSWRNETQIIAMVLSADSDNDPDVIAVTAASAAAYCSDLPFGDPIAAVRVGLLDGQLVANPTVAEQKTSKLNIVVAGTADGIVMVESGAFEVSEEKVVEALEFGHAQVKNRWRDQATPRPDQAKEGCGGSVSVRSGHLRQHEEDPRRQAAGCPEHRKASEEGKLPPRRRSPGGDSEGHSRRR